MTADVWLVAKVYGVCLLWQWLMWPLVRVLFKDMADRGWALSRLIGSLIVAITIWQMAYFGLGINTEKGLVIVMLAVAMITWYWILVIKKEKLRIDPVVVKYIAVEEYLFLFGLTLMTVIRGYMPDIRSLEKLMDFGFVYQYLHSPTLPANDMWMAGMSINYYSFGHFWGSVWIRSFGVVPGIGYNIMLAIIFGLALSLSFSVVVNIVSGRFVDKLIGGIVGALAVCVAGNSHTIWYYLSHNLSLDTYWYADATRFIHNTIHEFPSYSFVVSDLHGHVLDLPMAISFVLLLLYWSRAKNIVSEVLMGLWIGVMMMTNTWDVAVYGLLTSVFGIWQVMTRKFSWRRMIRSAIVVGGIALLTALPWLVSFKQTAEGIKTVTERTPLWQLGVLWTGGLISIILSWWASRKSENRGIVFALGITAVILIIIPEIVYAKDIYPSHPRANTMFKLTYQAFIMMGLLLGVTVGQRETGRHWHIATRGGRLALGLAILFSGLMFTSKAFPNYYNNLETYKGLNGEVWMTEVMPERYAVIEYLRSNKDEKNMVEAVGDSYTDFDAISVFSGVPTVMGWRVHEWLWRGGYEPVGKRDGEVKEIYETNDLVRTKELLMKYNVGWLVVGKEEKDKYRINELKLKMIGEVVLVNGNTRLIKVTKTNEI